MIKLQVMQYARRFIDSYRFGQDMGMSKISRGESCQKSWLNPFATR